MSALDDLQTLLASSAYKRQKLGTFEIDQMSRQVIDAFEAAALEAGGTLTTYATVAALKVVPTVGAGLTAGKMIVVSAATLIIGGISVTGPVHLQWAPLVNTALFPSRTYFEPFVVVPDDVWAGTKIGCWAAGDALYNNTLLREMKETAVLCGIGDPAADLGQAGNVYLNYIGGGTTVATPPIAWKKTGSGWILCDPPIGGLQNTLLTVAKSFQLFYSAAPATTNPLQVGLLGAFSTFGIGGVGMAASSLMPADYNKDQLALPLSASLLSPTNIYCDVDEDGNVTLYRQGGSFNDYQVPTALGRAITVVYTSDVSSYKQVYVRSGGGGQPELVADYAFGGGGGAGEYAEIATSSVHALGQRIT